MIMDDPDATILNYSLDVDDILKKYGIRSNKECEEAEAPSMSAMAQLSLSPKLINKKAKLTVYNMSDSDSDSKSPSPSKVSKKQTVSPKQLTAKATSPKTAVDPAQKALAALKKAQKKQEAENKRQEVAKNKEIKKLLNEANKQLKPDECMKYVTAIIDKTITENYAFDIASTFKELGSNYKLQSQIIPGTVTWMRVINSHVMDEECKSLKPNTSTEDIPNILLILSASELFDFIKLDKLVEHIKTIESIYIGKSISLGIIGLNKQLKSIEGKSLNSTDVMTALTEIQIYCNCCYRNLDNSKDLAALICQFTKAIAQRPYKLQQQEKHASTTWYMKADNKDCVKVDKLGNGLKRLWQQQITSFPLARLETAESIMEKYPTVHSLMEAYDFCVNKERETLLADIPVRRNAGPVSASRRIGNEMSKKINVFFNALDGDAIIS